MLRRRNALYFIAVCCIAITTFFPPFTYIQTFAEDVCPKDLKGGAVNDGRYNFQYRSWWWPNDATFVFCDCIRNSDNGLPLYVSWDGTNLSGWVPPGGEIHWYGGYPANLHDTVTESLWYGAALKKIDVVTMLPRLERQTRLQPIFSARYAELNASSDATLPSQPINVTTQSEGKIFVPILFGEQPRDKNQLLRMVEQNPGILTELDMTFTSKVESDNDGKVLKIDYDCRYQIRLPMTPFALFRLRVSNAEVQNSIFHAAEFPLDYRGATRPFNGSIEVHGKRLADINQKSGAMDILSPDGSIVLGSIPIKYFSAD